MFNVFVLYSGLRHCVTSRKAVFFLRRIRYETHVQLPSWSTTPCWVSVNRDWLLKWNS